jgi:hypothetical protein
MNELWISIAINVVLGIIAGVTATAWWKSQAVWLQRLVAAIAPGAVARTEISYVTPVKEKLGVEKLENTQQMIAKNIARIDVKDTLADLGVTALSATGPIIGAAIEKAVDNMKKTLPKETENLFS